MCVYNNKHKIQEDLEKHYIGLYNIDFINVISFSCVSIISFANSFNFGFFVLLYILCDVVNAVE